MAERLLGAWAKGMATGSTKTSPCALSGGSKKELSGSMDMPEISWEKLNHLQDPCPLAACICRLLFGTCMVVFSHQNRADRLSGDPIKVTCTWHLCDDDGTIVHQVSITVRG